MSGFNPRDLVPGGDDPHGPTLGTYFKMGGCIAAETALAIFFFAMFSETMGGTSNQLLCDLPIVGPVFCAVDENATVSHLLAGLLALFAVSVPIMIAKTTITERVYDDFQGWYAQPLNKIKLIVGGGLFIAVFLLEVLNIYTLIVQQSVVSPFAAPASTNDTLRLLAENKGLGVFVAILIAMLNLVVAFMTVSAALTLQSKMKG